MAQESYVVRIYRKQASAGPVRRVRDGVALVGVVEDVRSGVRHSFHDIEELWSILAACDPNNGGDRKRPTR
jgi:hypothetical protein